MLSTLTLLKSINWFFLQLKNKKCIRFDLKNSLCNQISTRFVLFIYKIISEKQMWFGQFTFSVVWWLAINLINYLNRGNIVDKRPQQQYRLRQLLFHCKNLIIKDCKKKVIMKSIILVRTTDRQTMKSMRWLLAMETHDFTNLNLIDHMNNNK